MLTPSSEIPLADSGSLTTGPSADSQAAFEIGRLPKPTWRISKILTSIYCLSTDLADHRLLPVSLARIIVHSMAPDGRPVAPSNAPTPMGTPMGSGFNTPGMTTPGVMTPRALGGGSVGDYLTAHLHKMAPLLSSHSYVGGSKALDSLVKLIASTESFFHPSNSGAWTSDVSSVFCLPGPVLLVE